MKKYYDETRGENISEKKEFLNTINPLDYSDDSAQLFVQLIYDYWKDRHTIKQMKRKWLAPKANLTFKQKLTKTKQN